MFGPCSLFVLDFLFSLTIPLSLFLSTNVTIVSISVWTLFPICIGVSVFSYHSSITISLCYYYNSIHKFLDLVPYLHWTFCFLLPFLYYFFSLLLNVSLNIFYCQILYSNGVGSQVLTTLVTTLPLHYKHIE